MPRNIESIVDVLNRDDVRGRVLKDGAYFDWMAGLMIAIYFAAARYKLLHELIIDRLSFDQKMRVLEKLPYRKQYKAIEAMPVIRQLQQARNLLAHEHHISHRHDKLAGSSWLYLFDDYPSSYDAPVKLAKRRIDRLFASSEFLPRSPSKRKT
jgi:hypothetical protein